jgi:hypothetical protein
MTWDFVGYICLFIEHQKVKTIENKDFALEDLGKKTREQK